MANIYYEASVAPATDGKTIDINDNGELTSIATLIFENITLDADKWVKEEPPTYMLFPYRYDIECTGVDGTYLPEVIFNLKDATDGVYAPISESDTNTVKIWSSLTRTTTIPTISCTKKGGLTT